MDKRSPQNEKEEKKKKRQEDEYDDPFIKIGRNGKPWKETGPRGGRGGGL